MTKTEYANYQKRVEAFFKREGITSLTADGEPWFSSRACECCRRALAGDRYDASGYNPTTDDIEEYTVCGDCVYYAEHGQLDDLTMLDLEAGE